jgi:hypothetical protein
LSNKVEWGSLAKAGLPHFYRRSIAMLIGMFIGLLICGALMVGFNNDRPKQVEIVVAQGYIRNLGYILIFMSAGALIGTFLID